MQRIFWSCTSSFCPEFSIFPSLSEGINSKFTVEESKHKSKEGFMLKFAKSKSENEKYDSRV